MIKIKDKKEVLKTAKEKNSPIQKTPIRLPMDFSAETLQARRKWNHMFKVLKETTYQVYFTQKNCPSEIKVR